MDFIVQGRSINNDCTCTYCKTHVCDLVVSNSRGLHCRDKKCESNLPEGYFEMQKLKEEML